MRRTTAVGLGLFATWAVHDLEELVTMADTSREVAGRLPQWVPVPADIRVGGFSRRHFTTGIAVMAAVMGAAALDGVRSDGRSWFFRTVLDGYGWHGLGHLAGAAVLGGYASGAATAPVVVLPYWLWARRELARQGRPLPTVNLTAIAATPVVILSAHAVTRAILRSTTPAVTAPDRDR